MERTENKTKSDLEVGWQDNLWY